MDAFVHQVREVATSRNLMVASLPRHQSNATSPPRHTRPTT
jgi:hypothetical protein